MKYYPVGLRLMSVVLALTLLFVEPMAAFAAQVDTNAVTAASDEMKSEGDSNKETEVSESKADDSSDKSAGEAEKQKATEPSKTTKDNTSDSSNKDSKEEKADISEDKASSDKASEDEELEEETDEELEDDESEEKDKDKKKKVQEDQNFSVDLGDFHIKAFVPAEAFDEEVEFKASQINLSSSEKELVDEAVSLGDVETIYAFDLRFEIDGEEVEPKEGCNVKISIESSKIDTDAVVHIKDDDTAEEIQSEITEDTVSFESDSFSKYALAGINGKQVLYKDSAYGAAYTDQKHTDENYSMDKGGFNKNRIGIRIFQKNENGASYEPKEIAPASDEKFFVFGSQNPDTFKFTFEAPVNYYIAKVEVCDWYSADNYKKVKTYKPSESYATSYSVDIALHRMTATNKVTNAIILDLEPIPTKLTGKYTYVNGATFVNYKNGNLTGKGSKGANTVFGDHFAFCSGQMDPDSNHCHYPQVYQGLATSDITNGVFRLSNDNGKLFFPNYNYYKYIKDNAGKWWWSPQDEFPYITDYYNDVDVKFNLDEDGYWTLDSSKYKYVYKDGKVTTSSGDQFRPFDDSHFGMTLPIHFSVAQDGLTNGKDTIFKFFGDDDVFVYVDGKLVLDLGGIHDAVHGQIDFTTGEILIQGDFANEITSSLDETCYVKKGLGTTNLYNIISENNVYELSQKEHILTVVYFERGAHKSNCKISYNFNKTEVRTADFKGLKVDENGKGLEGAEFTLYTDEACTQVATIGVGSPAVAVSDSEGTISFSGLSAGVITDSQDSVSKTYYLKETKAPEEYNLPTDARWRLDFTVPRNGEAKKVLTPLTDEARALSLDKNGNETSGHVAAIKNVPTKQPKKLTVVKTVTFGSDAYRDDDAQYIFRIEEITTDTVDIYTPMANQPYTIDGNPFTTDENGQFILKANETAVFENLMEKRYQVTEVDVISNNGYTLDNYETKVYIGGDAAVSRVGFVNYDVLAEETIHFENSLVKVFDWKLVKISTSGKTLMGGEFTLASESQDSPVTYYGKSAQDGTVLWYVSENDRENGNNPIVVPAGSYTLSESKAPNGYAKGEDVWHITIDKLNGVNAYITNQGDLSGHTSVQEDYLANGCVLKTVVFTFENTVNYTLPETGGRGIYICTISGVLLMIGAALLLYKNKRTIK